MNKPSWRSRLLLPCLAGVLAGVPAGLRAEGVTAVAPPVMYPATSWQGRGGAVLRIMRRLDSHVEQVPLKVGEAVTYGPLSLRLERCLQRPEGLPAQSAAQMHIEDVQDTGTPPYEGWMFTDDPALGAYAGALYDVQVIGCAGETVPPMVGPLPRPVVPQLPAIMAPHVEADAGEGGAYVPPVASPAPQAQGNAPDAGSNGPTSLLPPAAPAPAPQGGGASPAAQ